MAEPLTPEEEARLRDELTRGLRPLEGWLVGFERLLATLDAARAAAPLDVERLARALHGENNAGGKFDGARCPCRKEAERVAAEYARLSEDARRG